MTELKENILKKITTHEITPRSRLRFLASDLLFWLLALVCTVIGALAVSVIIGEITIAGVEELRALDMRERLPVVIQLAPFIWIGLFALFIVAAWLNYKRTYRAYRYQKTVGLCIVILSLVFGILLYGLGADRTIEEGVRKRVPLLESRREQRDSYLRENRPRLYERIQERREQRLKRGRPFDSRADRKPALRRPDRDQRPAQNRP